MSLSVQELRAKNRQSADVGARRDVKTFVWSCVVFVAATIAVVAGIRSLNPRAHQLPSPL